jgi:arylformamidase
MIDPQELDRQYNVRATLPDHAEYLQRWAGQSRAARDSLRCEADYYYGVGGQETLDIFPANHASAPLLMLIQSDDWSSSPRAGKCDLAFLAPTFVEAGISLALVSHSSPQDIGLTEVVRQLLRATVWIWHNACDLGVDPQRIFVGGHAAGAHLAAMLLAAQWSAYSRDLPDTLVSGGVCLSGVYDLVPLVRAPFLRDALQLDEAAARHLSPVSYLPRRSVPLVTAVGGRESSEYRRQNQLLAQAWAHCPITDVAMPEHHHLSIVEALGDKNSILFQATQKLIGI